MFLGNPLFEPMPVCDSHCVKRGDRFHLNFGFGSHTPMIKNGELNPDYYEYYWMWIHHAGQPFIDEYRMYGDEAKKAIDMFNNLLKNGKSIKDATDIVGDAFYKKGVKNTLPQPKKIINYEK